VKEKADAAAGAVANVDGHESDNVSDGSTTPPTSPKPVKALSVDSVNSVDGLYTLSGGDGLYYTQE
jgi:hypothetical protein